MKESKQVTKEKTRNNETILSPTSYYHSDALHYPLAVFSFNVAFVEFVFKLLIKSILPCDLPGVLKTLTEECISYISDQFGSDFFFSSNEQLFKMNLVFM